MTSPITPPSESNEEALSFHGVSKSFATPRRTTHALRDIDFAVRPGSITGLVGPDAAGKTTFMRLAAGLLRPDSGEIAVLGVDAVARPLTVQSSIGYMPQRFGLYEELSVRENLDLYADLQGVPRNRRAERYDRLLGMSDLEAFQSRLAGRLSGGMKQKLGLCCALVRSPRLLLLDEATVGVDPLSRRELWEIIRRLQEAERVTVLLTTAYLDEAARCDEVALLHEGRLLDRGRPETFLGRMTGRTWRVLSPAGTQRRVRTTLLQSEDVTDAVIRADEVRVVSTSSAPPDLATLSEDVGEVSVEPVPPKLEDAFVAMLRDGERTHDVPATGERTDPVSARPPEDGTVIEVDSLVRRFGDFVAVKGVTFGVRRGEIFGLLGPNGAGKSTTFRMLCGILPPSDGSLRVAGVDMRRATTKARGRIGYMSQGFSLYGDLSVRENLAFFSRVYGLRGRRRTQRVRWALEQFGLDDRADADSGGLPLGYQRRLAMACALMHEPDILFLDEPTSGVDPLARREFWDRINELADRGVTVMVTTHFMVEAEYCDRLAIMDAGSILTVGTPADIRSTVPTVEGHEPSIEEAFIRLIEERRGLPETQGKIE